MEDVSYFQGATMAMTPKGSRLMYRFKASVSVAV